MSKPVRDTNDPFFTAVPTTAPRPRLRLHLPPRLRRIVQAWNSLTRWQRVRYVFYVMTLAFVVFVAIRSWTFAEGGTWFFTHMLGVRRDRYGLEHGNDAGIAIIAAGLGYIVLLVMMLFYLLLAAPRDDNRPAPFGLVWSVIVLPLAAGCANSWIFLRLVVG